MSQTVQEIAAAWGKEEPEYKKLGEVISSFIKSHITELEILPEVSYRTKDLLSIIKKIRKKQREKEYNFSSINDKLGLRIICLFQEDMNTVDSFIKNNFQVKKAEYKQEELNYNKLDYISNHYDLSIDSSHLYFSKHKQYSDLIFELQVRTLNQHAWSNAAHSLAYKQEADISPVLKRKIYRLLSLYEIADDEFSSVNKTLLNLPDNKVYTIIRKLESKIYKFAQVDYDRDTSLYTIRILLSYFTVDEVDSIISGLDEFIVANEQKIRRIFDENRNRYFEMPILTQPEVFLIWHALEKYFFSIEDNWGNNFEISDLQQLSNLWGLNSNYD